MQGSAAGDLEVFWEGAGQAAPDSIRVQLQRCAQLLHQPSSPLHKSKESPVVLIVIVEITTVTKCTKIPW